jgi:hypothetical protein
MVRLMRMLKPAAEESATSALEGAGAHAIAAAAAAVAAKIQDLFDRVARLTRTPP